MNSPVEFGLGLIGIGRPWGYRDATVPDELQALTLLDRAFELGVRYFDTAPSYGVSEQRVGLFLRSLTPAERRKLTIATKFGEHWDFAAQTAFTDHSFAALKRSLDESVRILGSIDILQLHKTTPEVLKTDELARAWEYARSLGILKLGASVKDFESVRLVMNDGGYSVIQLPFNAEQWIFSDVVDNASASGLMVAVNRPFAMGKMLYENPDMTKAQAFRFILERKFHGVILSGTKSPSHLEENWRAFQQASL